MNTTYRVTTATGELLATIAKTDDGSHWTEIKSLVAENPGAEVKPVVTVSNPCHLHPAFEADYCPTCGTSREI